MRCLQPILHCYEQIKPLIEKGQFIYRAVSWPDKPMKKEQLSYPPALKLGAYGRANRPHAPLFYGSAGCHSTIMEIAPNLGDRLAISKWRLQQNLNIAVAGYTEKTFSGKAGMNRWPGITWAKQHAEDHRAKQHAEDHRAKNPVNQFVHEFLAHEFTKKVPQRKAWQYKISAAFCELLLNAYALELNGEAASEISGILYPSTPNEVSADNLAIRPNIADTHLEFISVQYVEISQKTNEPQYSMRGLDFADTLSEAGEIQWKNMFPQQLIAGTDHVIKVREQFIDIVDTKGISVGSFPLP